MKVSVRTRKRECDSTHSVCMRGLATVQAESVARKWRRHSADDRRTGSLGLSSNYMRPRPASPSAFIQMPVRAPSPWAAASECRLPTCHGYWTPRCARAYWRLITEQRHASSRTVNTEERRSRNTPLKICYN
ncbi:hypothetical protein NP493_339g02035 [Ridgeia piscesae]|uniref:Uncharacterized protein n=1 Tax=Ridgeia piscesae TaxID=27915 RepID=A0AAD9L4Z8_RIDPI|nr:hypothetical protein NP493_339g02035 [Ridgeia piscesae]